MGPRLAFILLLLLCLCDDARASEATIDSLSSRIDSLRAAGDYDAALVDARELLRHRVGARGFERERASRLVATLATIAAFSPEQRREMAEVDRLQSKIDDAGGRGAFAEAEGYARTQLEQRLRLLGDRHLESAESRNELAVVLQAQGRYVESERLCREALSIIREALGEESPEVTAALTNLGLVERGLGNFAAAEDCFRSALEIDRRLNGPVHPDVAVSQSNYAALLMARGRNAEAEAGFREVLRIRREVLGPEHPQIALTLNNLAVSLLNQGDYAAAEPLYRDALAIRRQALGPDHPDVASSLHNLAYLLQVQGDHAGAERLYREALAVWQRAFGADHPAIAKCLTNLANVLLLESQFAEAEESYDAALAMYRRLVGEAHPDIATCLHNLGRLHRLRGDPAGATALFDQALVMRRALLGEAHPDVAATELEIGLAAAARGDTTAAMASCRAALTLARELLGPAHPSVVQASSALGQLLRARRALPQAEQELNAAARAFEAARLRAGSGLARTTFLESPYPHLAALRLERGEGNAAWQAAELAQGRSLADLLLSAHRRDLSAAEAAAQDSVLGLLTPLESQVAQLERTPRAERSTEAQERLSLARSRLLNAEAGWAELQAGIARAHPITEGRSFELARIQASLEPGSAILGWVDDAPLLGQAERWGYVIRKRGAVHWARLPDPSGAAGFANPSSGDLRAEIARAGASSLGAPSVSAPSSLARALCRERVEPLLPFLDQVEELIVIPSGPMLGVPLDALSDEKGTMLGDRYSISYAPSATVFAWLREMPERARALSAAPALLLGDPATPAPASPDAPPRLSADAASVFGASGAFAAAVPQGWIQGTRPASSSAMILPVISS